MISYIGKRILISLPLLLGITLLSFVIMKAAPGDPVTMFLDPNMGAADIAQVRANLGFDKPIIVQYLYWLKSMVKGDFGYSYVTGKPVIKAIVERLPATLLLSVSSIACILLIAFPLGLLSGYKKDSFFDKSVTVVSFLGYSLPTFWLGLMLILVFALTLDMFPTAGFMDPDLMGAGVITKLINILHHLFLPLLTLIIGGIAGLIRYNRFGIINVLSQDYITAARARGVTENRIIFKHAFKNAALPIITLLGLMLPALVSGSFIVEYIFAWPGMGQLGVASVFSRDYPILMGTLTISSILIILGNLLADMTYAAVDPRIAKH
ncbi:ABC transporter permease [Thermoproteota archaeon]